MAVWFIVAQVPGNTFLLWLSCFKNIIETYFYVKSLAFRSLLLLLVFEIKHVELVFCITFFVSQSPAFVFLLLLLVLDITHNE